MTTLTLITLGHREDYGRDWWVRILHTQRWALVQFSVSWNDYPSWPYLQLKSGGGSLLDTLVWVWKLGLCVEICGRLWSYDLLDKALLDDDNDNDDTTDD